VKIDPIWTFLPIQLGIAGCVVPALVLAPPARGRMLLVPVLPGSGAHLAADAIDRGARLVGPGPIAGSLVVDGIRDRIVSGLLARGVLAMSAASADCGDRQGERP